MMLSPHEAKAHLAIVEALDAAKVKKWHWTYTHSVVEQPLKAIAPRCQQCRHALAFSPWVDGLRAVRCNWCGAGWKEAPL